MGDNLLRHFAQKGDGSYYSITYLGDSNVHVGSS